jgi:excisionase family DNA binding protein
MITACVSQQGYPDMSQMSTSLGHQEKPALAVPPREAGRLLALCLSEVYERMRSGELESYRDGRARRIPMESIHAYVARRRAASADGWQQISPQPPQASRRRKRQRLRERA